MQLREFPAESRAARSAESLREIREGLPQLVRSLVVYQRVREIRCFG